MSTLFGTAFSLSSDLLDLLLFSPRVNEPIDQSLFYLFKLKSNLFLYSKVINKVA